MSDKTTLLRAFNNTFFEFLDDIISIFPNDRKIMDAKTSFEFFKKANPTSLLKAWYHFVYLPYNAQIDVGNIQFFLDKDYAEDLNNVANSAEIMQTIDRLRNPIREMSEENKKHSIAYMQNLCKLSYLYITIAGV